jgi:monoamine oxidase
MRKKIVIIGGGISGLTAAQVLLKSGLTLDVTVLEARDRLGGRIDSKTMNNGDIVEMGAHWIHGHSDEHHLCQYAKLKDPQAVLSSVPFAYNFARVFMRGKSFSLKYLEKIFDDIYAARDLIQLQQKTRILTLQDEAKAIKLSLQGKYPDAELDYFCQLWQIKESEGANPYDECVYNCMIDGPSNFNFIEPEGIDYLITNGLNNIVEHLKENVHYQLTAEVTHILQQHGKVFTTYHRNGQSHIIESDYIINTLPWGVLKAGKVTFTPALSESKQQAINHTAMTAVIKVALTFDNQSFLTACNHHNHPLRENIIVFDGEDTGPFFAVNLNAVKLIGSSTLASKAGKLLGKFNDFDPILIEQVVQSYLFSFAPKVAASTLLLFISDYPTVLKHSELNEPELINLYLKAITKYYPSLNQDSLQDFASKAWLNDPYSLGAYPYITKDMQLADLLALAAREGNMIMAGDGIGIEFNSSPLNIQHSSLHAAMLSGQNAASTIISELSGL